MLAFMGSKGGCGRTTASILVALGLSRRGIRVNFVEVTGDDRQVWIHGRPGLPFETTAIKAQVARVSGLKSTHLLRPGRCVVLDLPADFPGRILADVDRFVLPIKGGYDDFMALDYDLKSLMSNNRGVSVSIIPMDLSRPAVNFLREVTQKYRSYLDIKVLTPGVTSGVCLDFDYLYDGTIRFGRLAQQCATDIADQISKGKP